MPRRKRKIQHCFDLASKKRARMSSDSASAVDGSQQQSSAPMDLPLVKERIKALSDVPAQENCLSGVLSGVQRIYAFINILCLNSLIVDVGCPSCQTNSLQFQFASQLGFAREVRLCCSQCKYSKSRISSEKCERTYDINLRLTQAFKHIGKGYAAIEKFCMVMNMPVFSSKTYRNCESIISSAYKSVKTTMMSTVYQKVKQAYGDLNAPDAQNIVDVAVSFDGTWLTRGHSSLFGVSCVIDLQTGYALDYQVMSKICRFCQNARRDLGDSAEFFFWYEGHKNECSLNHMGSANSMELAAAEILWKRSEQLGFRYTTMLSDGDSKAFTHLKNINVYGKDVTITKEECINHVGKRLGTALREVVKKCKAKGITLGGKKVGSLKDSTIKKLQRYYTSAILSNKGDAKKMKSSIYATLYHAISTDTKPQHFRCPVGKDSWCFYQSAVAHGRKPESHKTGVRTPINEKFFEYILPVYQRLAEDKLLERCKSCATQNSNESLHSMIWSKCPKDKFTHSNKIKTSVFEAVCEYNIGIVRSLHLQQKALQIPFGEVTEKLGNILLQRKKGFQSRRRNVKHQRARKLVTMAIKRREKQFKKAEGVTYKAGEF